MAAACYITLLCLLRPYDHLSCCGFNERSLIKTAFFCHIILTYKAVIGLKEPFSPAPHHGECKSGKVVYSTAFVELLQQNSILLFTLTTK